MATLLRRVNVATPSGLGAAYGPDAPAENRKHGQRGGGAGVVSVWLKRVRSTGVNTKAVLKQKTVRASACVKISLQ